MAAVRSDLSKWSDIRKEIVIINFEFRSPTKFVFG